MYVCDLNMHMQAFLLALNIHAFFDTEMRSNAQHI